MSIYQIWVAFATITRKELVRVFRIWSQTLLPSVITTTLYFVIFGKLIGSQVRDIQGVSYIAFIVPGLVMLGVITNSFSNVVSSFFGSKFQRNVDELIVSPTPNWVIIAGYCAGGSVRGLIVGILILLLALFFTSLQVYNILVFTLFIVLTAVTFSLGGLLNGIFATKFDDVSIFPIFVLTPLTYLGGVFYSIEQLPEFWRGVSRLNPILYMVDGFRYGFFGFSDINIWFSFFILAFLIVFLWMTNLILLRRGTGMKS